MVDLTPITFIIILEHLLMAAVITFFLHSGYRELKEHRNNKLNRVMADANDLKKINDNLGHQKGDELITQIASCLKQVIKNDGNCYRTGGDEFVICVKGKTRQEIETYVTCIRKELRRMNDRKDIPVSAAIGYAWTSEKAKNPITLIKERRIYEKEKTESHFHCIFGNSYGNITSVRLWRKEGGKRGKRYNHSLFVEHKPV